MKVDDVLEWTDGTDTHWWRVRGIHLGGIGVESLIEIECFLSHAPGWTGPWETHQMMFVPECLLRGCKVTTLDLPEPARS